MTELVQPQSLSTSAHFTFIEDREFDISLQNFIPFTAAYAESPLTIIDNTTVSKNNIPASTTLTMSITVVTFYKNAIGSSIDFYVVNTNGNVEFIISGQTIKETGVPTTINFTITRTGNFAVTDNTFSCVFIRGARASVGSVFVLVKEHSYFNATMTPMNPIGGM